MPVHDKGINMTVKVNVYTYRSDMEDSYIVQIRGQRETVDLGGRHTVFDL
jgi:hypothetical protein